MASFKDFCRSSARAAPSGRPHWLSSVDGAAPRPDEAPAAAAAAPAPAPPRTFATKLRCKVSCACRAGAGGLPSVAAVVSVVCPTTVRRRPLHALLYENFAAQAYEPKELCVLDTGGREPSPFFASLRDPRVRYRHVRSDGDGSGDERADFCVGNKRNALVEMARGDVIACFDDDNAYAPLYLDTMVDHLSSSGDRLVALGAFFTAKPRRGESGFASDWFDATLLDATRLDASGAPARGETMVFRKQELYVDLGRRFLEDQPVSEEGPMVPDDRRHALEVRGRRKPNPPRARVISDVPPRAQDDAGGGIFVHVDHGANCSGDLMLGADQGRELPSSLRAYFTTLFERHAGAYAACLDLELQGGNSLACARRAVGIC